MLSARMIFRGGKSSVHASVQGWKDFWNQNLHLQSYSQISLSLPQEGFHVVLAYGLKKTTMDLNAHLV